MPDRRILDFLVRCYMDLVNWIDQVVCPANFLSNYQKWKARGAPSSVDDVEFAVLLLRLCSYAAQFLPSPSYPVDRVRSMLLGDIRKQCDNIGDRLAKTCTSLDPRGSLVRVQHLMISGLSAQCEGRNDTFWETIGHTVLAAQRLGICKDPPSPIHAGLCWTEAELRQSTLCNLYVWDSILSRQLDRMPFLPDDSVDCAGGLLVQATTSEAGDACGTPDFFTERLLQARLARFWRSFRPRQGADYDLAIAEERYDKFCSEYLASLPSAFSFPPNKQWDGRLPKLPLQRQLLYICIFDCICWNFRSALLIDPDRVRDLPRYKQVQLASQKRVLAVSALNVLSSVAVLHNMLGASYTRHPGIVIHMFEAAILVGSLCIDPDFPGAEYGGSTQNIAPLGCFDVDIRTLTRGHCIKSVQDAVGRLRKLADVSEMADAGMRTLAILTDKMVLDRAEEAVDVAGIQHAMAEDSSCMLPFIDAADYGNAVDWLEFEQNHPDQNHPDQTVCLESPHSAKVSDDLNFILQMQTDYGFGDGPYVSSQSL
ncbi:hypothetical protein Daus18300_000229 [Diaporthe australafricana]|uniref:Xylanolytic transcriptional activator regulatory domain-containing protein n=1 Tax=Diaporthe australafricana TaxID=127596 RepID=A0ABR3Y4F8_9PEZI